MTEYTPVDSSMIDLVGYDASSKILEIRFIDTGLSYIMMCRYRFMTSWWKVVQKEFICVTA